MLVQRYRIELAFSGSFAEWERGDVSLVSDAEEFYFELSDLNVEEDLEQSLEALGISDEDYEFCEAKDFTEPAGFKQSESTKLGILLFGNGAKAQYELAVMAPPSDALTSAIHDAYRMASCRVEGDTINAYDDFPNVEVTPI